MGKAPETEKGEVILRREVGEKTPLWGKSLTERETEAKREQRQEMQDVEEPIPWDLTPDDVKLLEELVLPPGFVDISDLEKGSGTISRKKGNDCEWGKREEKETWGKEDLMQEDDPMEVGSSLGGLSVPPHMKGTKKADSRRNVLFPKKKAARDMDECSIGRQETNKRRKLVDWSTTHTLKRSLKKLNACFFQKYNLNLTCIILGLF